MRKLLFLFVIQLLFLNCSSIQKNEKVSYAEKIRDFERIISGLQKEYVLDYHNPGRRQHLSEAVFKQDSLIYRQCYQNFFEQYYSFVEWLLTFENDTIKKDLWFMYPNPLSSRIEECNLSMSNSRAAIVLIENFLTGKGFICYSCHFQDRKNCNESRYGYIKNWLAQYKNLSIENIRKKWAAENYH
jgi:hypothetical protein